MAGRNPTNGPNTVISVSPAQHAAHTLSIVLRTRAETAAATGKREEGEQNKRTARPLECYAIDTHCLQTNDC